MGLYQDLQDALTEAWDNDLSDAVVDIDFVVFGDAVYDPVTGIPSIPEALSTMRGIVTDSNTGEIVEEPNLTDTIEIVILDVDKNADFIIGSKVTHKSTDFKLVGYVIDPAGASHTVNCRRWA